MRSNTMIDKENLIAFIEQAFDGVEQPKQLTLHVAEAHDDYDYDNDAQHRRKDHTGRWQDIPTEHIKQYQSALSYLDKVGMRYYLPAYMIWYLRNLDDPDEVWSDNTLYTLDHHPKSKSLHAYHLERFSLFSKQQLKACALFIKYCAENQDYVDGEFAQKKYDRYWVQFDV